MPPQLNPTCYLERTPPEMQAKIESYLDRKSFLKLRRTSSIIYTGGQYLTELNKITHFEEWVDQEIKAIREIEERLNPYLRSANRTIKIIILINLICYIASGVMLYFGMKHKSYMTNLQSELDMTNDTCDSDECDSSQQINPNCNDICADIVKMNSKSTMFIFGGSLVATMTFVFTCIFTGPSLESDMRKYYNSRKKLDALGDFPDPILEEAKVIARFSGKTICLQDSMYRFLIFNKIRKDILLKQVDRDQSQEIVPSRYPTFFHEQKQESKEQDEHSIAVFSVNLV